MAKSKPKEKPEKKSPPQHICFSFAYILNGCVEIKSKDQYFSFTNKVPIGEIRKYRTIIESTLHNWSKKTIQQLEQDQDCYPVKKDIINKTRDNIAKVFQKAGYNQIWIEQNIQASDIYKFKIDKQIRMFGIVERNIVYILLYDLWHLINKDKKKNFSLPDNLVCTWCLKSCDKK